MYVKCGELRRSRRKRKLTHGMMSREAPKRAYLLAMCYHRISRMPGTGLKPESLVHCSRPASS